MEGTTSCYFPRESCSNGHNSTPFRWQNYYTIRLYLYTYIFSIPNAFPVYSYSATENNDNNAIWVDLLIES